MRVKTVKRKIVEFLATGFYVGRIRPAPGTWGTLVGIPFALLFKQGSPFFYMVASIALLFFAVEVAEVYEMVTGHHDTGEVVIDEIVGYVIALTWLPMTWQFFVAGFFVFRILDIWKPYPISVIDQKVRGGLGTILDDVAAGLLTNLILQIVYQKTDWLGHKWDGTTIGGLF